MKKFSQITFQLCRKSKVFLLIEVTKNVHYFTAVFKNLKLFVNLAEYSTRKRFYQCEEKSSLVYCSLNYMGSSQDKLVDPNDHFHKLLKHFTQIPTKLTIYSRQIRQFVSMVTNRLKFISSGKVVIGNLHFVILLTSNISWNPSNIFPLNKPAFQIFLVVVLNLFLYEFIANIKDIFSNNCQIMEGLHHAKTSKVGRTFK